MKNKSKIMKKPLTLLFLILICGFAANAKIYYVSNSGNDNNNGMSTTSPWKTLAKVSSFTGFTAGDQILFNRGQIFYGKLIINNSGASGNPITYGAYGSGANPVISGFTNVTSWVNLGGNIWESSSAVSTLSATNMVIINGVNTPMGRYPNTGFATVSSHSTNTSITSSSLTGSPNWTGAEVVIRKNHWTLDRNLITSQSGSTLYYKSGSPENATDKYGFFIQNDSRTLDVQNEWYYNHSTKKIRIYSISTPVNVKVSTVDTLVNLNQKNYITFDNLSFQGSNVATFQLYLGQNIAIQNCSIDYSGCTAVQCRGSIYPTIRNTTINHTNDNAIRLDYSSRNAYVGNNIIKNTGILPGMGSAWSRYTAIITFGNTSTIEYNEIDSTGFIGINFLGNNTIIRNNLINVSLMAIDDGGAIYSYNGPNVTYSGIKVLNNIILNATGAPIGTSDLQRSGEGIYMDGNISSVELSGNTVANCAFAGMFIHNSYGLQILNNTIYNNNYVQIYLRHDNINVSTLRNILMKKNIFISKPASQPILLFSTYTNDINIMGTADSNYFARPIDDNLTFLTDPTGTGSRTSRTLAGWQSYTLLDPHSHRSPKSITTVNDLRFEYNATKVSKTITLDANYIDVKGVSYNGSITLAPYTSAVLIRNGSATNQPPTANAGADQTITLPTSSLSLSGSGTDPNGTISAYNWTKISGPSGGTISSATTAATTVSALIQGIYKFQLKVTDNAGATDVDTVQVTVNGATTSTTTTTLLPAVNPANAVNGLNYSYYESATGYSAVPNFSTLAPVKTGTVSNITIGVSNRSTAYAFNFTGYINVPSDGQYTFYPTSDDGSMLYIDNVLVVNNDGLHGAVEKSGTIGLKSGKHAISLGYFQQSGGATCYVNYSGPGISKQAIPSSALYRVAGSVASDNSLNRIITSLPQVGIKAYPNPFINSIMIDINSPAGEYKLMLIDAIGRIIWTKIGNKTDGSFQQSVNTSTLQKGIYILRAIQNNKTSVIKLEK